MREQREHYPQRTSAACMPWDLPLSSYARIPRISVTASQNARAQQDSPKYDLRSRSTAGTREPECRRKRYFERALALQIGALCLRVEPFSKPPVDWSEQFASLLRLPLVAPAPCSSRGVSSQDFAWCTRSERSEGTATRVGGVRPPNRVHWSGPFFLCFTRAQPLPTVTLISKLDSVTAFQVLCLPGVAREYCVPKRAP